MSIIVSVYRVLAINESFNYMMRMRVELKYHVSYSVIVMGKLNSNRVKE